MADIITNHPIKGDDLILKVNRATQYHATQHQVNLDAEFEEYQTKDSNGKQYVLSGHSGTAQADGLVCVMSKTDASAANTMDTPSIIEAFNSGKQVELTLSIANELYTTNAWITSVALTGAVGQNATYSVSFKFSKLVNATA